MEPHGGTGGSHCLPEGKPPAQLGLPILSMLQFLLSPCFLLSLSEEDLKMGTRNSGDLLVLR